MELGYRAEIVSQTMLVVERKEGGFERGSQIRRGRVERERSTRSGWEASGRSDGLSLENLVTVIGEVCSLLGVERADILGKLNAPLLQRLLDAGLGTQ
ncbi:hypothetical protein D3C75_365900 [compost metagenome]